jgi:hypothetical protein
MLLPRHQHQPELDHSKNGSDGKRFTCSLAFALAIILDGVRSWHEYRKDVFEPICSR